MRIQQTILWTGISVMAGVFCLGAAEPQHSKVEPDVPSVGETQGLDGAPMVLILAGPFTMGSEVGRWRRLEDISPMIEGQAQPAMALRRMATLLNCFCDRHYG